MANLSRTLGPFAYSLGLLGVLLCLVLLPTALRKDRFLYTASPAPSKHKTHFDMSARFQRVGPDGAAGAWVTLGELAADAPGGLLINFWATWCPPCLEELPSLELLDRQLRAQASSEIPLPRLVTISVDESQREIQGLFKTLPFSPQLLVLHDPDGAFSESVGTTRFPETYLLRQDGTVQHRWLGPQDWLSEGVLRRLASSQM